MKNFFEIANVYPLLWQWTALLAVGWAVHGLLARKDARWRLMLWRSVLAFSLALPLAGLWPVEIVTIDVPFSNASLETAASAPPPAVNVVATAPSALAASTAQAAAKPPQQSAAPVSTRASWSWASVAIVVWALGSAVAAMRLLVMQVGLMRLRKQTRPADEAIARRAREIQADFGIKHIATISVSDEIQSPFLCGVFAPMILLPQRFIDTLSPDELCALLRHEIAHLRGRDLAWAWAWRWLQTIGWFHPLVWKTSAAHSLACEEEADRAASGRLEERENYSRLLSQMTLRILALPRVETQLTFNAAAQIVRRLRHLRDHTATVWKTRHTVAGLALASALFVTIVGCRISRSDSQVSADGFKKLTVCVEDESGKPVEGAVVTATGYRVKGIHFPDAYGWSTNFAPLRRTASSDSNGNAVIEYPVMAREREKEYTGALFLQVDHPSFCWASVENNLGRHEKPVRLTRGATVAISAFYGPNREPVTNLIPFMSYRAWEENRVHTEDGKCVCSRVTPGSHLLLLMGKLPSGDVVYSETVVVEAAAGAAVQASVELKPVLRLEGRVDDRVPRPVKNGWAMVSVRPKEYSATSGVGDDHFFQRYGEPNSWHSCRPIREDGTFLFESVPPGEADVLVLGEGFATRSEGGASNRINGVLFVSSSLTTPQAFPLVAPVTRIKVKTEPTATIELKAVDKHGQPLSNIWAGVSPNVFRMPGVYWMRETSDQSFVNLEKMPHPRFSGRTGADGMLVLTNLPPETSHIEAESETYRVPINKNDVFSARHVRITLAPGQTNRLELKLEPVGADYIGTTKNPKNKP